MATPAGPTIKKPKGKACLPLTKRYLSSDDVLQVCVTTKTKDDDISTQYSLDLTGTVVSQKPSHLGQGKYLLMQCFRQGTYLRAKDICFSFSVQ